jgi:hypothetical protein
MDILAAMDRRSKGVATVDTSTAALATVRLRSAPFAEYLHLARFRGRRLIVNVLYHVLG